MEEVITKIEKIVLSAIFFDKDKFDEIYESISHKDFIMPLHICMFKAFESLQKINMPFTPEIVCIEMQKEMSNITLDDISIVIAESPIANIDSYVEQIKNASINRSLFALASFIRDTSLKPGSKANDILEETQRRIYALSMDNTSNDFRSSIEIIESTMSILENVKNLQGAIKGIDTGFAELNSLTTGFNDGELIIIGARPGMGKTALILSMALKIISSGKGVAIFSLEMPAEQLMLRMLSSRGRIPLQSMRSGSLNDDEWSKLSLISQELCQKNNLYIDDSSGLTLASLRTKLRKLFARDSSVGIVMIDYLQLMGQNNKENSDRYSIISEISRGLKLLARELNVPIIALSQLNRSVESREDKRPIMSDLRDSGSIEQDADIILFLYRDAYYKERESRNMKKIAIKKKQQGEEIDIPEVFIAPETEEVDIIVAKNRNGAAGDSVKALYHKKYTLFEDMEESEMTSMAIQNVTTLYLDDTELNTDTSGLPKI
ncbi:replicative DNA helicase [Helicobacter muridarum]|uniref:Replicative DNA helicase n=1 Tax=Helicobacter muridarum TaxID=216 RepID=A0A099U1M5_9HELI|nr:replicative DNA helicase [Helicobacter muridarum]TLE00904.1 replicative DNA helicase [Helicobacter muridarum]STQ86679.1 replicative DNA helicase [Helicobacter muridarum]